jgi:hypothetical protein
MQFSTLLALAALAIGQAAAGTLNHRHFHMRREAHGALQVENVEKYGFPVPYSVPIANLL